LKSNSKREGLKTSPLFLSLFSEFLGLFKYRKGYANIQRQGAQKTEPRVYNLKVTCMDIRWAVRFAAQHSRPCAPQGMSVFQQLPPW